MDGFFVIGLGALLLSLLGKKKGGSVTIIDTQQNYTRIKFKLAYGNMYLQSWIIKGDKPNIQENNGYIFIAEYPTNSDGISFFIYKKSIGGVSLDKLVFSTAYTIKQIS